MAEENFQEKTETATPKKREKTREEGQTAKSVEVPSVFVLLAGILVLYFSGYVSYKNLTDIMRNSFTFDSIPDFNIHYIVSLLKTFLEQVFLFILPVFISVFVIALLSNFLQVGFVFSHKAITPKFSRLNVIKGFGRLFSKKSLMELVKSVLKLSIIGIVSYFVVKGEMENIPILYHQSIGQILLYMCKVSFKIFIWTISVMIIIAILDYLFQRWQFEEQIKMTKQEVKDESKQAEGDPQVKARIRSLQQQAARRRMMQEVPKADVVVTNPTHLALAIQYDAMGMNAPKILAKGAGAVAERIKIVAKENNIPVVEDKELAQNLYKTVEIGDEIPVTLFKAVAELLAYVYKLKGKTA
jgi:flagellar biosynthesis protein FlhB